VAQEEERGGGIVGVGGMREKGRQGGVGLGDGQGEKRGGQGRGEKTTAGMKRRREEPKRLR